MSFARYANHGGGYVYMLCKRDSFLQCRQDHLADPIRGSSQEQVDAYLKLTCNTACAGHMLMTQSNYQPNRSLGEFASLKTETY